MKEEDVSVLFGLAHSKSREHTNNKSTGKRCVHHDEILFVRRVGEVSPDDVAQTLSQAFMKWKFGVEKPSQYNEGLQR